MLKPETGNAITPALAKTMGSRQSVDVLQGYLSGQALPIKTPTGDLMAKHRHNSMVEVSKDYESQTAANTRSKTPATASRGARQSNNS